MLIMNQQITQIFEKLEANRTFNSVTVRGMQQVVALWVHQNYMLEIKILD